MVYPKSGQRARRSSSFSHAQTKGRDEGLDDVPSGTRRPSLPRLSSRSVMKLPNISIGSLVQEQERRVEHESDGFARGEGELRQTLDGVGVDMSVVKYDGCGNGRPVYTSLDNEASVEDGRANTTAQKHIPSMPRRHKVWGNLVQENTSSLDASVHSAPIVGPTISLEWLDRQNEFTTQRTLGHGKSPIRAIDTTTSPPTEAHLEPTGKLRCCKCKRGHDLHTLPEGSHPLSILNCICTHRSCTHCTLEGPQIKRFVPMSEPEVVQLSEDANKQIRFGVFCDGCGLSWRAQEVLDRKVSALQRISGMPRSLVKKSLQPLRHARSLSNLSGGGGGEQVVLLTAASSMNLRQLASEMEKGFGKQADVATVRFSGIRCTCGLVTDATSLCFQIVDPPEKHAVEMSEGALDTQAGAVTEKSKAVRFASTPEDAARGHGTLVLWLRGREFPNPLMSSPVTADGLE